MDRKHFLIQPIPFRDEDGEPSDDGMMALSLVQAEALTDAAEMMIDEWFMSYDQVRSEDEFDTKEFAQSPMGWHMPERFVHRFDWGTVKRFLVTAIDFVGRLHSDGVHHPRSTAEAIVLRSLIVTAQVVIEERGDDDAMDFSSFEDMAFEDLDHELLWSYQDDGVEDDAVALAKVGIGAELQFANWFEPFRSTLRVHPYATNAVWNADED